MTIKDMREKRAKLLLDAQVIALKDEKTSEERAQVKTMLADASTIQEDITAAEALETANAEVRSSNRPPLAQVGEATVEVKEDRSAKEVAAFRNYLVNGVNGMDSTLRPYLRAQSVGTASGGGYLVPTGFEKDIAVAIKSWGQALTVVKQITTDSGNPIQWPTNNDTTNYSTVLTEGSTVSEADLTFGQMTINVDQFTTGMVRVSNQLLQDSAFDLQSWISQSFATRVARGLNVAITTGTTNVTGLCASSVVANGATCASGETTALAYSDIVALHASVDPGYRVNAAFMFNDAVFNELLGIKDTLGRPLFIPNPSTGDLDKLLGHPVVINQNMPAAAASAIAMLFGDFSNYVLRNVQTLAVKRLDERYADLNQTAFVGFHRQGGVYLNAGTNPIKSLVYAAS